MNSNLIRQQCNVSLLLFQEINLASVLYVWEKAFLFIDCL